MTVSQRLFAALCVTLLGSSLAQSVPAQGPLTIQLQDDVEGKLTWDGGPTVSMAPAGAGVEVTYTLSDDELSTLLAQRKAALAVERTARATLRVSAPEALTSGLNAVDPRVRPLSRALIGLREDLYYAPQEPQAVTLRTSTSWGGGPQRELVVTRDGSARLNYRRGKRRWSLPAAKLTREERMALRDEVQRVYRLDRFVGIPHDETKDYVEVLLTGGKRTVRFYGSGVEGLRAKARGMGRVLKQIHTRLFTYSEQSLYGRVEGGGIRCGELLLEAGGMQALSDLQPGAVVLVRALVSDDGTWGTALRLIPRNIGGGIYWPTQAEEDPIPKPAARPTGIVGGLHD